MEILILKTVIQSSYSEILALHSSTHSSRSSIPYELLKTETQIKLETCILI